MGRKKLLKKLGEFFSMDQRARERRKEELRDILARLKGKECELRERLELETDPQRRKALESKIHVVHQQRKKGVGMLKELRDEES